MNRLRPETSALLLIGWQDRTLRLLPETARRGPLERATFLRQVAERMGVFTLATELAPRVNGHLLPALLGTPVLVHHRLSAAVDTDLITRLRDQGRHQVVVCGLETHTAVAQTAMDLVDAGMHVLLAADAAATTVPDHHAASVWRLRHAGVGTTSSEATAFEWCDDVTSPAHVELWRAHRPTPR